MKWTSWGHSCGWRKVSQFHASYTKATKGYAWFGCWLVELESSVRAPGTPVNGHPEPDQQRLNVHDRRPYLGTLGRALGEKISLWRGLEQNPVEDQTLNVLRKRHLPTRPGKETDGKKLDRVTWPRAQQNVSERTGWELHVLQGGPGQWKPRMSMEFSN